MLTLRFNLLYLQDYYDQLMVTDCNNNTIEAGESNDLIEKMGLTFAKFDSNRGVMLHIEDTGKITFSTKGLDFAGEHNVKFTYDNLSCTVKVLTKGRENEKRILKVMIDIYQRKHPQESKMCENLYKYACLRIDKCPFMETKTFCSGCKVHCYQKEYRSQVKKVMRFSGKYMLFYHPLLTIKHGWLSLKERRRKNV